MKQGKRDEKKNENTENIWINTHKHFKIEYFERKFCDILNIVHNKCFCNTKYIMFLFQLFPIRHSVLVCILHFNDVFYYTYIH